MRNIHQKIIAIQFLSVVVLVTLKILGLISWPWIMVAGPLWWINLPNSIFVILAAGTPFYLHRSGTDLTPGCTRAVVIGQFLVTWGIWVVCYLMKIDPVFCAVPFILPMFNFDSAS